MQGCVAAFEGVESIAIVGAPFADAGERTLAQRIAVVLVLVEVGVEVIEKRRSFSSSPDVNDRGQGEDSDENQGNDGNKVLEVRQMGGHCDLLNLKFATAQKKADCKNEALAVWTGFRWKSRRGPKS